MEWDLGDFDEDPRTKPVTTERATTFGFPRKLLEPAVPWESRYLVLNLLFMLLYPATLLGGAYLCYSDWLPTLVVGSGPVALVFGTLGYLWMLRSADSLTASIAAEPTPRYANVFLVSLLGVPLAILAVGAAGYFFARQFVATACWAAVTMLLFHYRGARPVRFAQEYVIASPWISRAERHYRPRGSDRPDLRFLALVLVVTLVGPPLTSLTWTIAGVAALVALKLLVSVRSLASYGSLPELTVYLVRRARVLCGAYLNYPNVTASDPQAWPAPETRDGRYVTAFLLAGSLLATLFTGLSFFCPWDFFAALTIPNYISESSPLPRPHEAYAWMFGPWICLVAAPSKLGMLLAFSIAAALIFTTPPAILLALYFERLVAIEKLYQEAKHNQREAA